VNQAGNVIKHERRQRGWSGVLEELTASFTAPYCLKTALSASLLSNFPPIPHTINLVSALSMSPLAARASVRPDIARRRTPGASSVGGAGRSLGSGSIGSIASRALAEALLPMRMGGNSPCGPGICSASPDQAWERSRGVGAAVSAGRTLVMSLLTRGICGSSCAAAAPAAAAAAAAARSRAQQQLLSRRLY
jgi:hypothetical protein